MDADDRTRVSDAPRSATGREWEVFVRTDADGPMKHVGSVTASDADAAHERASQLFAWTADAVWLCPADETRRYTTHALGESGDSDSGPGNADRESGDAASGDAGAAESGGGSA